MSSHGTRDFKSPRIKDKTFPSNFIKTSKYNIITFLPLSLLGQFRRYANIYFLFIAIIQSIRILSPLNPISAIAPLVFVLGLSMIREGIEDYNRHRSDNQVNAMPCSVMPASSKQPQPTTWANITVGDLMYVRQDEMFAADIIAIRSAHESGACYIETSSLDGEKNLKSKSALKETQVSRSNSFLVSAGPPNALLGEFEGSIVVDGQKKLLNGKNLLLRGAFLRNTEWVLGVVVYTGQDTKIMKNADPARIKQSQIEITMNKLILGILCIQILACVSSAVLCSWWLSQEGSHHKYIDSSQYSTTQWSVIAFFSYFLLYNTMIPISLVVSLEFVKVFQCYFIERDEDMYVEKREVFAKAQTSTINEELGQVEYIFSDKTGTLTCNQMEFKYCIIGDTLYGQEEAKSQSHQPEENQTKVTAGFKHSIFTFKDETLKGIIEGREQTKAEFKRNYHLVSEDGAERINYANQRDLIKEFFFLLASAHECLAQHVDGEIVYQGPSPDEITLVDAAMNMGFKFEGQSASQQNFTILGKSKQVELLNAFEFNSDRKRMSVIIKDQDGKYKLFVKGADNIIKERLAPQQPFLPFIENKLSEFSGVGLRTLLMAMRVLSEKEYLSFESTMKALADSPNREKEKDQIAEQYEKNLYLLGATAVEDKLQPDVPETIADFLKANIKVWMLTGDKLETAENIARSCKLIQGNFTVMRFAETEISKLRQKVFDTKDTYFLCIKEKRKKSILVEGGALKLILEDQQLKREFLKMAPGCDSVVCCRVTPKQKAQVVALIKDGLKRITLAIGDGANDVNMIQEAHIGIGLYGNEGMRAVQSSDFALGEFRCLWKLLLVHGHWSYIRISEMILYFFYKNMIFTVPQYLYSFFSAYSAQTFFDDWYITFYNLFFTALPLIVRATLDRNVYYKVNCRNEKVEDLYRRSQAYLKGKFPLMYYIGQKQQIFTMPNFIFWWGQGFVHGCLVYFLVMGCFDTESITGQGHSAGFAPLSITAYTAIIFIVDIKIALYTKFWTWINVIGLVILSIAIYIAYFFISHFFVGTYSEFTPLYLVVSPQFYLTIAFLNAAVIIFDVIVNAILHEFFATEVDKIIEWRNNFKQLARSPDAIKRIEMIQLDKREKGERLWGDTFYEEVLEEQLKSEREKNMMCFDEQQPHVDSKFLNKQPTSPIEPVAAGPGRQQELQKVPQPFTTKQYVR